VSGGYAYTDARIVGATSATIVPGNRVGLVPYHTFTLWNKYEFVEWFALGAGIIHQTDSFASSDDTVLLPGWTRVDAGIFGKYRMWDGCC
jgi:catecholate siderophore receptor